MLPPPRDWPTVHRTYERLEASRYTYGRLFKFAITYKWLHFYVCMTRSTSFLVTKIRAVVHTRWRDCQPDDITCQHKRPKRLRNTTNAACIQRTQLASGYCTGHRRSWTAGPFCCYESTYISELVFLRRAQPLYRFKVLRALLCAIPR